MEASSWKSVTTPEKSSDFSTSKLWHHRPNHYVLQTRIEILCRMKVFKSSCLRSEVKFSKKYTFGSLARMSALPHSASNLCSTLGRSLAPVQAVRSAMVNELSLRICDQWAEAGKQTRSAKVLRFTGVQQSFVLKAPAVPAKIAPQRAAFATKRGAGRIVDLRPSIFSPQS